MRRPASSGIGSFVWLLASSIAAGSCTGQDGRVTVGVRPTYRGAASGAPAETFADAGSSTTAEEHSGATALAGAGGATMIAGAGGASAIAGPGAGASAIAGPGAGVAGAGIGAAGAGGSLGPNEDECGTIPSQLAGKVTSGRVSGTGLIEYNIKAPNVFTRLRTTLAVPAEPSPDGPIFLWAGVQPTPNAMSFQPIGNGVLESVLTWGPSCAPGAPTSYSTWWISPMYVNISASDPPYSGCHGGKVVLAKPKQLLDIHVQLDGTKWVQTVVNRDTMEASDFSLDLKGQAQGRAFFDIELQTSNKPTEDIIFTNTVLSMDMSDPTACQPVMRGMNDFASKPRVSSDGRHCCIDRIVLRAMGVPATTIDP